MEIIIHKINFLNYYFQKEQGKPLLIGNNNLGNLFYEFLIYYGYNFDPKDSIIDPNGIYKNLDIFDRGFFAKYSDLIIIDPLNPNNNVAKNTRQFKNIQLAFTIAAIAAKEECECGCHYETEYLNDYMKMEHCILKRIFNAVKRYSINDSY